MIAKILTDFSLAFCVGYCWAILFGTPFRGLWIAGLLGGFGHCLRFIELELGIGLITATLVASVTIGVLGIYCSYKTRNPSVVFTMPACITMIPGLFAYRSMLGVIKLSDMDIITKNPNILQEIAHNAVLTFSLLFTLAVGISISALLIRDRNKKIFNL